MQRVLFIILFIISASVSAQVRTVVYQSIGDVYKSRPDFKSEYRSMPSKKMQPFDMQKLLVDDKDEKGINAKPFRFGYGFDVSYTLDDGTWEETDTLRVWTMKISSSGAYSLNFIFDRLRLTQGAELYIFNTDATMMYGPVTALQNITEGTFLTDIIAGDEAIIRLVEPITSTERSVLSISKVVHAYVDMYPSRTFGYNTASDPCYLDVMCYSAWNTWETDGVVQILLAGGTAKGSGSLLNNTEENFRPFILTAFHNADSDWSGNLSNSEKSTAQNWNFKFRYRKVCGQNFIVDEWMTYNRADFRAAWYDTDFLLMELKSPFYTDGEIVFLGWDRNNSHHTTSTLIHHPLGDVMKISFGTGFSPNDNILNFKYNLQYPINTHWIDYITEGGIHQGSSGGPVFNQNRKVVGQLHGVKGSGCIAVLDFAYYGMFNKSWTGGGTNDTRLSNWLDPINSGAMTTSHTRPFLISPILSGPDIVCSSGATFTVENTGSAPVTWSCHPAMYPVGNTTGTSCFFKSQGNMGDVWVRATITFPSGRSVTVQKDISRSGPPLASLIGYGWAPIGGILFTYDGQNGTYNPSEDIYFEVRSNVNLTPFPNIASGYISPTNVTGIGLMNPANNTPIEVRYSKECGMSNWKSITINGNSSFSIASAYPNPVSDILNIDIDAQTKSIAPITTTAKQLKIDPIYDIRLYDGQGNLLRQQKVKGGTVQFNVAGLPNGTYYLHIYDGVNDKPEMRQIVVEH